MAGYTLLCSVEYRSFELKYLMCFTGRKLFKKVLFIFQERLKRLLFLTSDSDILMFEPRQKSEAADGTKS